MLIKTDDRLGYLWDVTDEVQWYLNRMGIKAWQEDEIPNVLFVLDESNGYDIISYAQENKYNAKAIAQAITNNILTDIENGVETWN